MTLAPSDLHKSTDEIFADIGRLLMGPELGALPQPLSALIQMGQAWLDQRKMALCEVICRDNRVQAALAHGQLGADFVALVVDIVESSTLRLSPVPPASAGLLFCRLGYHKLCPKLSAAPPP